VTITKIVRVLVRNITPHKCRLLLNTNFRQFYIPTEAFKKNTVQKRPVFTNEDDFKNIMA